MVDKQQPKKAAKPSQQSRNSSGQTKPVKSSNAKHKKLPWWQTTAYIIANLAWVGASVIGAQLIIGYPLIAIIGAESFSQPVWTAIYTALSYMLALVLILFLPPAVINLWRTVSHNHKSKSNAKPKPKSSAKIPSRHMLGLDGWPTWTDIGLAPAGFIVYLILAAILVALFSLFPWFDSGEAQDVGFSFTIVGIDRVWAFISLVIVAPIAEEVIFRGWLYGKLRHLFSHQVSRVAGMILSIFLVSLLFGIVHLQWNVGVNVFAMSIILCLLREFTGTIYAGILLHILKNGIAFYLLYVLGSGQA